MDAFDGQGAGSGSQSGIDDDGGGAPAVQFEIDLETPPSLPQESSSAQPAALPSSPPPAAPPAIPQTYTPEQVQEAVRRAEAAERSANQALAWTRPYAEALAQQTNQQNLPRHRSIEELNNDPTATAADLYKLNEYTMAQRMAQVRAEMEYTARQATSEQAARGMFNASAVGAGNDFDAVMSRYLQPIYQANPVMKQVFSQILPEAPAVGEYLVGFLHEMHERAGGDMLKMVNGIRHAMSALRSDGKTQQARVTEAARAQAQKVIRAGDGQQGTVTKQRVDADWIKSASDKDFDAFDRQVAGGL